MSIIVLHPSPKSISKSLLLCNYTGSFLLSRPGTALQITSGNAPASHLLRQSWRKTGEDGDLIRSGECIGELYFIINNLLICVTLIYKNILRLAYLIFI